MNTKPAAQIKISTGAKPVENLKGISGGLRSNLQKKMDDTIAGQQQKIG